MKRNRPARRRLFRALGLITAPLLLMTAITPVAQAYWVTMIESLAFPGRCLDSNDAGNVYMSPCHGGNAHMSWIMEYQSTDAFDGRDQVKFKNGATGRLLSQYRLHGGYLSTSPRDNSNQRQVFDGVGTGWANVALRSSHQEATQGWAPHLCVEAVSVANAASGNCENNGVQRWRVRTCFKGEVIGGVSVAGTWRGLR